MSIQQLTSQKSVSPAIAAAVIVVVLAIVGFLIYRGVGPRPVPATAVSAQQAASDQWLIGKAKEAKGNFANLSPADQQKAQEVTHGYGSFAISAIYSNK